MPTIAPDPTRLGTVEDVTGPRVSVKLDNETAHGLLFVRGEGYRVGQVGSFVRIPAGYVDLFGIVVQVGAGAAPGPPELTAQLDSRWLRVELVGEGRRSGKFERGISQYPSIGDAVHVVTESDLRSVYAPPGSESHVAIGRVASAEGIRAYVELNRLVSRHCAVVGSTGAGKTTAVASLLSALSDKSRFPAARVVLLDLHGEYSRTFGDRAKVLRANADTANGEQSFHLPFWALKYEELVALAMGPLSGGANAYVQGLVLEAKLQSTPSGKAHKIQKTILSVDTPLPFCIHRLWFDLHNLQYATHSAKPSDIQSETTRTYETDASGNPMEKGDAQSVRRPRFKGTKNEGGDSDKIYKSASADLMRSQTDTLEGKLRDPRLRFLFQPGPWTVTPEGKTEADLDALLALWLGGDRPITVFDLSGIPSTVLDDLVGVLLRILYDAMLWGRRRPEGGRDRPLLIVLEEAHSYLGKSEKEKDSPASGRAARAARQIAREGRKYGVGLMLVSQRPSEIDSTILSQCGTTVALRLTNEADRGHIRSCSSDNLEGLFAMLPILRTGEALVIGEAVNIPVRTMIDLPPLERRPDSEDPLVVTKPGLDGKRKPRVGWTEPLEKEDYATLIRAWRTQDPTFVATTPPPAGSAP